MIRFYLLVFAALGFLQSAHSQTVVRYDGQASLEARLDWARTAARTDGQSSFRFGFAIQRDAEENSRIGHYRNAGGKTLADILDLGDGLASSSLDYKEAAEKELARLATESDRQIVRRPMAVLLKLSTAAGQLQEVFVADYDSQVWFEGEVLMWGGDASDSDALALATRLYQSAKPASLREDLVPLVGVLNPTDKTFAVLNNILRADTSPDVREQAVFWIGHHNTDLAYTTVLQTIQSDPDSNVREHAVFVLSRFDRDSVFDELVQIAHSKTDDGVAEQARFWVGRRIADQSPKPESASSEDRKVKRQALYALYGDDEDDESVRALAEIASTATSTVVRREAILMLSRSDRPAALDALVAIYREQVKPIRDR